MPSFIRISIAAMGILALASFGHVSKLKLPKIFMNHYSEVEAGEISVGDELYEVQSFYLCKHEVTNIEYREFLSHIATERPDLLPEVSIDTAAWVELLPYAAPMTDYYHRHPAYNNYPVVNVSHEAALIYCNWLTEFNREKGLFAEAKGYEVTYRLPERAEWVKAARGGSTGRQYAWDGHHMRSAKGYFLANFRRVDDSRMRYDIENKEYQVMPFSGVPITLDPSDPRHNLPEFTAPAQSFYSSELGFYNMNGNVAEMLATPGLAAGGSWMHAGYDIRNESVMEYPAPNPMVGFRVLAVVSQL